MRWGWEKTYARYVARRKSLCMKDLTYITLVGNLMSTLCNLMLATTNSADVPRAGRPGSARPRRGLTPSETCRAASAARALRGPYRLKSSLTVLLGIETV